ncbi:unnamed protein product, partial [Mesorhabditis belari]|uniref:Uncharacterized protein n=1 Tax=Mesorhabditis belari TaxID=2138241 RepID=A0AAF3FRK1_9BILA
MDTNITFYCETAAHLAFFTVYSIQNAMIVIIAIVFVSIFSQEDT